MNFLDDEDNQQLIDELDGIDYNQSQENIEN